MTDSTPRPDRRAERIALVGFFLQLLAFAILLGTSIWSESSAIRAGAYLALVGLPIWVTLFLTLKQVRRVRDEEFETAELLRARDPAAESALFEDAGEELAIEKNRIKWLVKYLLPSVTILLSLAILLHHFLGWSWTISEAFDPQKVARTSDPTIMAVFVVFGWSSTVSAAPIERTASSGHSVSTTRHRIREK